MDPIHHQNNSSWRFTVVDIRVFGLSGAPDRPWIYSANPPSSLSARQWEDLKMTVMEGYYWEYKLFQLGIMFATLILALAIFINVDYYFGLPDDSKIFGYSFVAAFLLHYFLADALFGAWRSGTVRDAVYGLQPRFRQEGVELEFSTEGGTWFFVVGIVTVTRSQYEPKTAEDLAAERDAGELC